MFTSKFRFYSIGIVAANKPMSTDIAQVVPLEVLPLLDGELTADRTVLESEGETASGQKYTVSVEASNAVDAKWLNIGTNRITSPDVRRGERVLLWQYGDADKFYWTSMNMDDNLRKLETVVWAWSDTQDEGDTELTPENTYTLEISTHTKQVTFRTCKADGEPFSYTLQFNTKDGIVTLTDDIDNFIELNSEEHRITLQNNDTTNVILDKRNILFYAPDDVLGQIDRDCKINVGNDFILNVGNDFNVVVGNDYSVSVGNNHSLEVGNNMDVSVSSNLNETVGGDHTETVSGNETITVAGNLGLTGATVSLSSAGGVALSGASVSSTSNGSFSMQAAGSCEISASDLTLDSSSVSVKGNLMIEGNITWSGVATGYHPDH